MVNDLIFETGFKLRSPVEKGRKTKAQKATCFSIFLWKDSWPEFGGFLSHSPLANRYIYILYTRSVEIVAPAKFGLFRWGFASVASMFVCTNKISGKLKHIIKPSRVRSIEHNFDWKLFFCHFLGQNHIRLNFHLKFWPPLWSLPCLNNKGGCTTSTMIYIWDICKMITRYICSVHVCMASDTKWQNHNWRRSQFMMEYDSTKAQVFRKSTFFRFSLGTKETKMEVWFVLATKVAVLWAAV